MSALVPDDEQSEACYASSKAIEHPRGPLRYRVKSRMRELYVVGIDVGNVGMGQPKDATDEEDVL